MSEQTKPSILPPGLPDDMRAKGELRHATAANGQGFRPMQRSLQARAAAYRLHSL